MDVGTNTLFQVVPVVICMRVVVSARALCLKFFIKITTCQAIMPTLLIVQVGLLADRIAEDAVGDYERNRTSSVVLDTVITANYESQDTSGMQTRDTDDQRDPQCFSFPNVTPIFRAREG
jgi:hypothetical protein